MLKVTQLVIVQTGNKIEFLIPNPVYCSTVADIATDSMDGGNPQKNTFQLPKKKKKKLCISEKDIIFLPEFVPTLRNIFLELSQRTSYCTFCKSIIQVN